MLEVPEGSSPERIERSYRALKQQFAPERLEGRDLGPEQEYLEEIHAQLDEAYRVLADADLRRGYDDALRLDEQETGDWSGKVRAETDFDTGEALAAEGRFDEAARAYGEARARDDQAEYRTMEAWSIYRANGETAEAARTVLPMVYDEMEHTPGQYMIHVIAARLHQGAGDTEQAVSQYQEALNLKPEIEEVFNELEALLLEAGHTDVLEEQYRRTLLQLGQTAQEWAARLWRRLTVLYHQRLKDQRRSRTALEVVRAIEPEEEVLELELELELFPDDD